VEHTTWGRGKVVVVDGPYVSVHFTQLEGQAKGPRRRLLLTATQLSVSDTQSDPVLDRVAVGESSGSTRKRLVQPHRHTPVHDLDQAISWFTKQYPGRFADADFVGEELEYKRDAHRAFIQRLGNGQAEFLLENGAFSEIARALDNLFHATNIPSRFEIMATHDGLKDPEAAAKLLRRLLDFLAVSNASTLDLLADAVASLPAPKDGSRVLTWPNVTILPFLAAPDRFMVLKPGSSRRMADRMGADLLYSPKPAWHTYDALLQMSARLLEHLSPLGARDYIDVQSFMWVTRDLD
jgi:hypothetical protein